MPSPGTMKLREGPLTALVGVCHLLEELLHDAVAPLPVQLQRLGGVAQVSAVNHVLQHLAQDMTHDMT